MNENGLGAVAELYLCTQRTDDGRVCVDVGGTLLTTTQVVGVQRKARRGCLRSLRCVAGELKKERLALLPGH